MLLKPLLLPITVLAILVGADADRAPIVNLLYAKYEGRVNSTTNAATFLGIRYAAPPTGSWRWTAPRPPSYTQDIIQANSFPPQCIQGASYGSAPTNPHRPRKRAAVPSEDCLFLNVFTPGLLPRKKLPVLVFIHGGGYDVGDISLFNGQNLFDVSGGGVVVVSFQYRLGILGFLAGDAVKKNGALNAGLLDQEFALQWVHQHIAKFGGDPTQVTIWGESAGAGSVLHHLVARNGAPTPKLFRGAITSSTYLPPQYKFDDIIPEQLFDEVVNRSNCTSSSNKLACLRGTDVEVIAAANGAMDLAGFYGTFTFVPVVDGIFIVRRPSESFSQKKVKSVPLLAITNTNEGSPFVDAVAAATANTTVYISNLFPMLSPSQVSAAALQYQSVGNNTVDKINAIMDETIFKCPTYFMLSAFSGRKYKGEFAVPPANHGADLSYYFPDLEFLNPSFNNTKFRTAFVHSFFNFVRALDPNVKRVPDVTPQWERYSESKIEMRFNKTLDNQPAIQPLTTSDALLERCRFWQTVSEFTGQ